ncbi:MAG: S-methyl-5'-thioadenosine phosphorylase [Candidatus Heimdallarchaeota archaeon]|nr:S-methyl-5'-thioadenosine phosphorylase [Candidatus Heimdallarchaeota archaeon]
MFEMNIDYGIIGGSGFYELIGISKEQKISTPFGEVQTNIYDFNGSKLAFIPRHGIGHKIPPHLINYRANIYALFSLGVKKIISTSAVGSMKEKITPGDFIIPNQFIDFTIARPKTFFDGNFSVEMLNGSRKQGVVHIDVTEPYCENLRKSLLDSLKATGNKVHFKGVYVCTEGPRFETPAEILAFKRMGGTIVGMTSVSECILAKELDICYATICLVTNFAAGMQKKITIEEVVSLFQNKKIDLEKILLGAFHITKNE